MMRPSLAHLLEPPCGGQAAEDDRDQLGLDGPAETVSVAVVDLGGDVVGAEGLVRGASLNDPLDHAGQGGLAADVHGGGGEEGLRGRRSWRDDATGGQLGGFGGGGLEGFQGRSQGRQLGGVQGLLFSMVGPLLGVEGLSLPVMGDLLLQTGHDGFHGQRGGHTHPLPGCQYPGFSILHRTWRCQ